MNSSRKASNARVCALFSLFLLFFLFFHDQSYVFAAECVGKTCVDVYVENGQLVIEGHKGSAKKAKAVPKRTVIPGAPVVPKKAAPSPTVTSTRRSPVLSQPKKATVRKKSVQRSAKKSVRKVTSDVSLSDKLVKLLPTAAIAKQPNENALVNVPVIYWSDLPTIFTTKVSIVGEVIDVTMRPSFLWSFGDGTFFATTQAGRPYPDQKITHIYSHSGTYVVTMLATWGGTWSHNGVARAITGEIRKLSVAVLSVANGPTRITQ